MATLFKPTRPYPLPTNPEIVDRDGKPHIRIREKGKAVFYPLSDDETKYLKPAAKWAADVRFADGTRKRVRFSPNKDAAGLMLSELLKRIENEKAGIRDVYADHRKRTLADLLDEYQRHHQDRGNTDKQAEQTRSRCEKVFTGCGAVLLTDMDATAAEGWLGDRRRLSKKDGGISAQTSNHYVTAIKAFGNWLVKARRLPENPFRHLAKMNVDLDLRHVRRPLTAEEFDRLLSAAMVGEPYRGLEGPARVMLYIVAAYTGLRASELGSLTPLSFTFDTSPPTLTVAAAYSKHRREDTVPLHPDLVGQLRPWLASFDPSALLWPGKWAKQFTAAAMLRKDLEAARSAWIQEGRTEAERCEREASDFLAYKDRDGGTADFHALRHTFITNLVKAGVQPKDAKELARHSTIMLTMDRYAHVGIQDTAAAVARLPGLTPREQVAQPVRLRATGTDAVGEFREQQRAATGAAAGGNGRELARTNEEVCTVEDDETGVGQSTIEPLRLQRFEEDREQLRTESSAEREGFEPSMGLHPYRFSRPTHSTTLPPLRRARSIL